MNEAERAAVSAHPELRRLADLRDGGGWRFIHREDASGNVDLSTGFRTWPDGSADVLGVLGSTDARAWRTDPDGGVVWKREGDLAHVVNGLLELPAPDPLAPRLVIPGPTPPTLWTP